MPACARMCVFVSLQSWNANDGIGFISCRREVSHFVAAVFVASGGKRDGLPQSLDKMQGFVCVTLRQNEK